MAEIGEPIKRRVVIPQTLPSETPYPAVNPPVKEPEKVLKKELV